MKTHNYRAAIIGLGGISDVHIKSLIDIGIPIAALCDNKPNHVAAMVDKHKDHLQECATYTDYNELLNSDSADGGIDVLHICLPHYLHAPVAIAALEKGIHVVCEKPMATAVNDAEDMIAAAKKTGARLEVIFQNRFNPGSQAIKKAIESRELGKVLGGWLQVTWHRDETYYTNSDWRGRWETEGGGVLINQSIHTFDLMNYFLASIGAPTAVYGSIANRAHPLIEVEDVAEGVIFYGDVKVSFFANNYHPYNAPVRLEIICEKGKLALRDDTATITYADGRIETCSTDDTTALLYGKSYWGYSHIKQIKAFYENLASGTGQLVCGEDGLITQRLINGIYESARLCEVYSI